MWEDVLRGPRNAHLKECQEAVQLLLLRAAIETHAAGI